MSKYDEIREIEAELRAASRGIDPEETSSPLREQALIHGAALTIQHQRDVIRQLQSRLQEKSEKDH